MTATLPSLRMSSQACWMRWRSASSVFRLSAIMGRESENFSTDWISLGS